MAANLDGDVLADEHAGEDDGAWLDISVPTLVHNQLAAFGKRMGLTADGYAKLLLFQALHPLLAAEPGMADQPDQPLDDADVSRELWTQQLRQIDGKWDQGPAPRFVRADLRTYHADDFTWSEQGKPAHQWAHIGLDGIDALSISQDSPPD